MNVVLLADKKVRKNFETAMRKNANHNLVGVEMIIRGNTMTRIAEHHNPHILVVYRNVPISKDGLILNDLISFLRIKSPNMRIVYVYGEITDNTDFATTAEFLTQNGINDIVSSYSIEKIIEVIDNPLKKEDIDKFIEELFTEDTPDETAVAENTVYEQHYEELHIDFPTVTENTGFSIDEVRYIPEEQTETANTLVIGIAQLQHHNGCTHTAFEMAVTLSEKNSVALIIADDNTFENLSVFHKINPITAKNGLNVQGIDVYPYIKYSEIIKEYGVIIIDFSYLNDIQKRAYSECNVKLMLSSSAEWDISSLSRYIEYTENSRDNFYLFPRVSSSKFIKYNKQFIKSGIKAYRLHNSPDWIKPCADNIAVYKQILSRFSNTPMPKPKKRLFKVK